MQHRKFGRSLSRETNQKKALFLSLIRGFFKHGHLTSTDAKIKAILPEIERLSAIACKNDLNSRRELFRYLQSQSWVNNVCENMAKTFVNQNDNFTRQKQIKIRQGDSSVVVKLSLAKAVKFSKSKEKAPKVKAEVIKPATPANKAAKK